MEPSARSSREPDLHDARIRAAFERYWRDNLRVMAVLLVVWAFVSLGCGVVFAAWLNQVHLPFTGYPLGFWFAQQGSIIVFVLCILAYCIAMNRLDLRHHRDIEAARKAR